MPNFYPIMVAFAILMLLLLVCLVDAIPTTLDGPFPPLTVSLDDSGFRGNAVDLPGTDPRVRRRVNGFEPEQISVSLSSLADSVWISWITGFSFFFFFLFLFSLDCGFRGFWMPVLNFM